MQYKDFVTTYSTEINKERCDILPTVGAVLGLSGRSHNLMPFVYKATKALVVLENHEAYQLSLQEQIKELTSPGEPSLDQARSRIERIRELKEKYSESVAYAAHVGSHLLEEAVETSKSPFSLPQLISRLKRSVHLNRLVLKYTYELNGATEFWEKITLKEKPI